MSKWIEIRDEGEMSATGVTRIWTVRNRRTNEAIGTIRWYGGFRRYVFYPAVSDFREVLFDDQCLAMIAAFLLQANVAHKAIAADRKRGSMEA